MPRLHRGQVKRYCRGRREGSRRQIAQGREHRAGSQVHEGGSHHHELLRPQRCLDGLAAAVYVMGAFTKPEGTILGPSEIPPGSNTQVVSKVLAKQPADLSLLAAERADIAHRLRDSKATELRGLLSDSIVAKLTSEGKLKVYPDALQRAISAYSQR